MADLLEGLLRDKRDAISKADDHLSAVLMEPGPLGIGDIVRYDHLRSRWLIWNGVRWRPDLVKRINHITREKVAEWFGSGALDGDQMKAILPIFDVPKKENVLRSLASQPAIAMTGNEWDTDGYLVGFDNGILDLRVGEFYSEPDPNLMVSKTVGADWDPTAECPQFESFLSQIMGEDADLVAYLKRLIGYSMIGTQSEQKFWMWVGRGSNGKGVLARTLKDVFGDYADTPSDTMYMKTRMGSARSDAARPDLLRLQSVRFTYMSEPPGGQFNEEMLKSHTGEDSILARNLYARAEQMAQFTPTHKIIFLTNDPPKTDDVGVSMRRRVRVVWFNQDYSEAPNRQLEDILKAEKAGILNLAIKEALRWVAEGMPEPALVTRWSAEYIEENDPLAAFITERCEVGRQVTGSSVSLWASYEDWMTQRGTESMSRTGFGLAMGRRFKSKHTMTGNVYVGVRAKNAMELADDGA